jgi:hypothetical protein
MTKSRLSKGIKKYIRNEKNKIRKAGFSIEEKKKSIENLYGKFTKKEAPKVETNK